MAYGTTNPRVFGSRRLRGFVASTARMAPDEDLIIVASGSLAIVHTSNRVSRAHGHQLEHSKSISIAGLANDIILLDAAPGSRAPIRPIRSILSHDRRPWAPYLTRPDFEWSETMCLRSRDETQAQLNGLHGSWNPNGTAITIKMYAELQGLLEKSRKYVVKFESEDFTEEIDGEERTFTAYFRDPWKFILELVTDPSLANDIVWYPYRKYLVIDGAHQRLRDEAYSADLWWDMQDKLPHIPGMHHYIAPLMLWLDEGRITSHTNMYPMLLRALSLPSAVRNGSGNGGSWLAGFMVQIKDHRDPKTRTVKRRSSLHFANETFTTNGESVTCGDALARARVLFTAIPIVSLDGKEADMYTSTRAAISHSPCSRCLVRADQLCLLSGHVFESRTMALMKKIYEDAMNMEYKKDAEELLQQYGLHAVMINNSSPYEAYSYDLLHSDDSGKWKRIWQRVREVLEGPKVTGLLTKNIANVPRWPGLKHFENCILPCIVQLLPTNSPWIHLIRAHLRYRMIMGLHCITNEQIVRKEKYAAEYEKWCKRIAQKHPEYHWNFPTQHDVYHSSDNIRMKGAPTVYCTRESSHQENCDSAQHVNHRNNDKLHGYCQELLDLMEKESMAHWRRSSGGTTTSATIDGLVGGLGEKNADAGAAINKSYEADCTNEVIKPVIVNGDDGKIKDLCALPVQHICNEMTTTQSFASTTAPTA
ncbi:hypothetical protein C8F01DRAFT_1369721 [Mycena amicta]|nr:hypothetical protein C8F01DRAFT_1369721 [Mycena amicta]